MPLPLVQQPLLHGDAGEKVQGGKGLVQQEQIAAGEHGAGKGRPLPHAAGELVGHLAGAAGQAHLGQGLLRPLPPLGAAQAAGHLQGEGHVLPHGAPGEEQILLGHVAAVPLAPGNGRAAHPNLSGLGLQQAVDQAEDGALAAAAHPQDAVKGSRLRPEGEGVDDVKVLAGVPVGHLVKFQDGHGYRSRFQAMSQKPSSYRLQATKISSSRRYSASVHPSARASISAIRALLVCW